MARARPRAADAPPPAVDQAPTPRYFIVFREGAVEAGLDWLTNTAGVEVLSTEETDGALPANRLGNKGLLFDRLGVVSAPLTIEKLEKFDPLNFEDENCPIQLLRQEGVMNVLAEAPRLVPSFGAFSAEYLRGYRDGVQQLAAGLGAASEGASLLPAMMIPVQAVVTDGPVATGVLAPALPSPDYLRGYADGVSQLVNSLTPPAGLAAPSFAPTVAAADAEAYEDDAEAAWGLRATGVVDSSLTGRNASVAILDTGIDFNHPDFPEARAQAAESFVPGEGVQDEHGHGTYCAGIVCGPKRPAGGGPRYGIAPEAQLSVGKVLDRRGQGAEWGIVAGINWALRRKCRVILLPLGMAPRGPRPELFYALVSRRAGRQNSILIAAAGGHSNRAEGNVQPVAVPANGGDVVGVGAVGPDLEVANFSNGGVLPAAGGIDVVGPGVNVRSAWLDALKTRTISGTSAAAAFTAGVAALTAQALGRNPSARDILNTVLLTARPLPQPSTDVGKGLLQAPAGPLA
jgi:subtilisin family serine protease